MSKDYLLDTHVWLWSLLEPGRLRKKTRSSLTASEATLWLSPISVWETSLLVERGRLEVDAGSRPWIQEALAASGIGEAALNHEIALLSREVDLEHDDPADRFIVATASVYQLILVTVDERLLRGTGYDAIRA
ncbi:MAG: type II toxin-antitoxin system VapC family toxin [Myxococcales bacterium]|nr:type II toxin-antitoxin system VapC family toxin [Myxococcales bacterium]MDH3484128.1 type II toxin-antitoxin system VapC family toxin [Myxococcales bacterium]